MALWAAVVQTAKLFGSQRKLWVPFVVPAVVEAALIGLLWLAPHPPFSAVLAPPIRYAVGERVLHYPWHLWFLYTAMPHMHLAASVLAGAFMTGVVCAMVRQVHEGQRLSVREALIGGQVRYGRTVLIWLVSWAMAKGVVAVLERATPQAHAPWIPLTGLIGLQVLLVYAIPAAVFNGASWWKALAQGAREALRYPLSTLTMVAIPSAVVVAGTLWASPAQVARWMAQTAPEWSLAFVAGRLVLWTVADAVITVGASHLWWAHRAARATVRAAAHASVSHVGGPGGALRGKAKTLCTANAVGVVLTLACLGCSAEYNGERLFWKAQQIGAPIFKEPDRASAEQLAAVLQAFDRVIRDVPDTAWAARAQAVVAQIYFLQHDVVRARETYSLLLLNYNHEQELCLAARLAIAKTYEAEQNWDAAIATYTEIAEWHPWSSLGLQVPLAVAQLYERLGRPEQAQAAFRAAVPLYAQRVAQAPATELQVLAKAYLAMTHLRLGQWEQAVKILEEIVGASSETRRPWALVTLGAVYEAKLGDPQTAKGFYERLVTEFPRHPLGEAAKVKLEQFGVAVIPEAAPIMPATPGS